MQPRDAYANLKVLLHDLRCKDTAYMFDPMHRSILLNAEVLMKSIDTKLPLLDRGWDQLTKARQPVIEEVPEVRDRVDVPTCYDKTEPYASDSGKEYIDYDPKKIKTINYTYGMHTLDTARAAAEKIGRVVDYQKNDFKKLFSFKVVPK